MSIADVSSLSIREKLQLMECLWLDLRGVVESADIPTSHQAILDQRRARVESGESRLHEWDDVKDSIGRK
jgi:hypothetical protein